MRGPIVVGADATETSRLAVDEAASIATSTGQELVVTFVRRTPLAGLSVFAPVGGKTVKDMPPEMSSSTTGGARRRTEGIFLFESAVTH